MQRYFEDIEVGETWTSEPVTLTEADIIRFASEYDPQPMHTDPEAAANGRFGSLIASGWQLASLSMRMFVTSGSFGDTPMVGLGLEELRWRLPGRPGDRMTTTREVIETSRHEKRPEFGRIRTRVTMFNQDDDVVMTYTVLAQVPVRDPSKV
ncbi:MaoC family dehydratase [Martelella limonii]|uniref:MaoC family dehydratase n=1 Tax=Martelella limonii TaxID=1647649 RepID=UPI0015812E47|nr:MaoC family dehydratase [Martelella limonii]